VAFGRIHSIRSCPVVGCRAQTSSSPKCDLRSSVFVMCNTATLCLRRRDFSSGLTSSYLAAAPLPLRPEYEWRLSCVRLIGEQDTSCTPSGTERLGSWRCLSSKWLLQRKQHCTLVYHAEQARRHHLSFLKLIRGWISVQRARMVATSAYLRR
jgi:hypothetical protein